MNDRLKFRVWDEINKNYLKKEFIDIFLSADNGVKILNKKTGLFIPDKDKEQCTGLKDKNGKLIFEGDIILGENYLFPCYDNRKIAIGWDKEVGGFKMNAFNMKEVEVIGNIHQDSHLLGGNNEKND